LLEAQTTPLGDLMSSSLVADRHQVRSVPIEDPVIRAEGPERELGRAERRLHQVWVAHGTQVPVIVFDFDRIGGQGHGLILDRCREPSYTHTVTGALGRPRSA
jgi:hypothetical protein